MTPINSAVSTVFWNNSTAPAFFARSTCSTWSAAVKKYHRSAVNAPDISQPIHNPKAIPWFAPAVLEILREEYVHENKVWLSLLHAVQSAGPVFGSEHVESFAAKHQRQP